MAGLANVFALSLAASVPAAPADMPEPEEMPAPTTLAFEADAQHRMTVPVRIGPQDGRFLVDTGAQNTILSDRLVQRLGLAPSGRAMVLGVAGGTVVDTVTVDTLSLGGRSFSNITAAILADQHLGADGIVGLDSLQDQHVLIDFAQNRIIVDDAPAATSRGFDIVVRARRRSGQLIITRAAIDGVSVDVILDTGADASIGNRALQRTLARAEPRSGGTTLLSVTGQEIAADLHVARTLAIGGVEMRNVPIAYADAPPFDRLGLSRRPAILLGMSELRSFSRVAIDFSRRKVMFDVPAPPVRKARVAAN